MTFWRSLDETPAVMASRQMRALLLFGLVMLIGGIVALFHVRMEPPEMRPYVAVLLVVAACLQLAVLRRSEKVRRHKRALDDESAGIQYGNLSLKPPPETRQKACVRRRRKGIRLRA